MDFNFVVVGNIVGSDGSYDKFEALWPKIVSKNPKLLAVLGDISTDGSPDSIDAAYEKLHTFNSRFGIPVEVTPGESELIDGEVPDWYRHYFGEPMASFKVEGVNFISLNSGSKKLSSKQLDFLSRQLTSPSFVLSYCPPSAGFWSLDALQEGAEEFLSVLTEKSPFVIGAVFSCVRSAGREELVDQGMVLETPAFLVGNSGGESYEIGKFGYSKPMPNSALLLTVRRGQLDYEFL
jgi:hypothetical protein